MQQHPSFGDWLVEKRGSTPLRSFAEQVGVDVGTISRTERHRTEILLTTAVRICLGLDVSLGQFFYEWQGWVPAGFVQLAPEEWHGSLTGSDVQRWLRRVLEGNPRNQSL